MNAIIDVGGGLRGIYGAGVFDRCLDDSLHFDMCIGVSAGSGNASAFLSEQKKRMYRFFCDYSQRKEYMSIKNFIRNGSYINLSYIYSTLSDSNGEDPIDYEKIRQYDGKYIVVVTNAETGEAYYFSNDSISQDDYKVLGASCAIPTVCRPVEVDGERYFDGGVADPVPINKALEEGADKIVLVLTKPEDYRFDNKRNGFLAKFIKGKYPEAAKKLNVCYKAYNEAVDFAQMLAKQGKCLIVAPEDCCGVGTLTKNKEKLDMLYKKGYKDAEKIKAFL